jgi:hypothetical protein
MITSLAWRKAAYEFATKRRGFNRILPQTDPKDGRVPNKNQDTCVGTMCGNISGMFSIDEDMNVHGVTKWFRHSRWQFLFQFTVERGPVWFCTCGSHWLWIGRIEYDTGLRVLLEVSKSMIYSSQMPDPR